MEIFLGFKKYFLISTINLTLNQINPVKLFLTLIFFILFFTEMSVAQPSPIISSFQDYSKSIKTNDKNTLVDLKKSIPNVVLDLKYGTSNNFTKINLYKKVSTTYLRKDAAFALLNVNNELKSLGFSLKIFDAYRPYSVTKLMWNLVHDERYVANPTNGSGHNRGIAVDLTIIDIQTNKELNMGTGFDNFTDSAHHSFTKNLSPQIIKNRTLLKATMEKFGFKSLETEWWHYSFQSKEAYDVMDINFKKLAKKIR